MVYISVKRIAPDFVCSLQVSHYCRKSSRQRGNYCRQCNVCQWVGQQNEKYYATPHQPVLPLEPFQKWGLDFVRPFKLATTRTNNNYVIVAIYYYTKWVEANAL